MSSKAKISRWSRGLLFIAAIFVVATMFLPIWKIELFAPQYPEGLVLLIYADKLAGDVEIINGLNHYIGMKTLHTEDFVEFSVLRYILGFFAGLILLTAIIGRRTLVYTTFFALVAFCIVAMADFYRWNYNYGHDLDPAAAIKVPGMAYQPPLIGYKQLLNFGAYSIPDTGGLFLMGAALLILFVILWERNVFARWFKQKSVASSSLILISSVFLLSCESGGPRPVKLNVDTCAFCKMTITDAQFATQATTQKGRHYVFDDIICLVAFVKENKDIPFEGYYVADFCHPTDFISLDKAILLESDSLRSPMGGNYAAFIHQDSVDHYQSRLSASEVSWAELIR